MSRGLRGFQRPPVCADLPPWRAFESHFIVRSASKGASKSLSSEGLESFDLREIGGQSRAREQESGPLDF